MKPLPLEFNKGGFLYKQIHREENYAVYEQYDTDRRIALEVFEINKNEEREIFNKVFEASESVPPTTQWGRNAYTVRTYQQAMRKIEEMKLSKKVHS